MSSATFIQGCVCEEPDCGNSPSFFFNIINDASGKDFIFDLKNSIDQIEVYAGSKQLDIVQSKDFYASSTIEFLVVYLNPAKSIYTFVIANDTIPVSIEFSGTEDKCCPGLFYEMGKVTRDSFELESDSDGIYLIRI